MTSWDTKGAEMYFPLPFYGREFAALASDVARRLAARLPDRETVAFLLVAVALIAVAGVVLAENLPAFYPPRVA